MESDAQLNSVPSTLQKKTLPHVFWFKVFKIFSASDLINLYFSSVVFRDALLCFECFKRPYDFMSKIYNEEQWENLLKRNFRKFYVKLKEEVFLLDKPVLLYINYKFVSSMIFDLSLFSIFNHFCFCKRSCDYNSDGTYVDQPCEHCSLIYPQGFDMHNIFQDIIDERDFTIDFNKLFYKHSLMSLDACHTGTFFNKRFKE